MGYKSLTFCVPAFITVLYDIHKLNIAYTVYTDDFTCQVNGKVQAKCIYINIYAPQWDFYYKRIYDIMLWNSSLLSHGLHAAELKWDPDGERAWLGPTWQPPGEAGSTVTVSRDSVSGPSRPHGQRLVRVLSSLNLGLNHCGLVKNQTGKLDLRRGAVLLNRPWWMCRPCTWTAWFPPAYTTVSSLCVWAAVAQLSVALSKWTISQFGLIWRVSNSIAEPEGTWGDGRVSELVWEKHFWWKRS